MRGDSDDRDEKSRHRDDDTRTEQAKRVVEDYAQALREMLHKWFN
jgi:hypothetical protein